LTPGASDSPEAVFRRIQELFRDLGLFEKTLTLTHQGHKYLARCDTHAFTVYRLIDKCHVPPGAPGWPVCLVTQESAVDETCPPFHPEDEFNSGLTLQDWLRLIEDSFGGRG
jgi:hypothetical protein